MKRQAHLLLPDGEQKIIPVEEGDSLLEAIRRAGVFIRSSCGGHASCSECKVKVKSGADGLTPPPFEEIQLLGNVFHITQERLACQCALTEEKAEIRLDLSAHCPNEVRPKQAGNSRIRVRKKGQFKKEAPPAPDKPARLGGGKRPRRFSRPKDSEGRAKTERPQNRGDFQKQRGKK